MVSSHLRINALIPFPSMVRGSGPITIAKQNGIWTIGFGALGNTTVNGTLQVTQGLSVGGPSFPTAFGVGSAIEVQSLGDVTASFFRWSSGTAAGPDIVLGKSRSGVIGVHTIVNNGDILGNIDFVGSNGVSFDLAAQISAYVDGVPGASADMPGRIVLATSRDGTASVVEALRIDSSQRINIGGANQVGQRFEINEVSPADTSKVGISGGLYSNNSAGFLMRINKSRGATLGAHAAVTNNTGIWGFDCYGSDGTQFCQAAGWDATVDGAVGANSVPAKQLWYTTKVGDNNVTEVFRIDSALRFTIGSAQAPGGGVGNQFGAKFEVLTTSASTITASLARWSADSGGPVIFVNKSRNATIGQHTILQNNDNLLSLGGFGSDGTNYLQAAAINFEIDAAPASGSMPGRIKMFTAPASSAVVERFRIDNAGAIYLIGVGTTGSAANAFINNASSPVNSILRSTSSLRYKADLSEVPIERLEAALAMRPIEYRSLAQCDDQSIRLVGLGAEDVAPVDPALVNLDHRGRPDGVQYERVNLLRTEALKLRCAALEEKVAQLEARLQS